MFPPSAINAAGRMSAPFQEPASTAASKPHSAREPSEGRCRSLFCAEVVGAIVVMAGRTWATEVILSKVESSGSVAGLLQQGELLVQLVKLMVDVGDLLALFGRIHGRVAFQFDACRKQGNLTDRDQLIVAGRGESAGRQQPDSLLLLGGVRTLAVGDHEVLDFDFEVGGQVLAPDKRISRNQGRLP